MEPAEMAMLVTESERAWQGLGRVHYGPASANEAQSRSYRRSLYVVADMAAGEAFTPENLRAIRPGHGLPPKYLEELMGKHVRQAVKRGTPASWSLLG